LGAVPASEELNSFSQTRIHPADSSSMIVPFRYIMLTGLKYLKISFRTMVAVQHIIRLKNLEKKQKNT